MRAGTKPSQQTAVRPGKPSARPVFLRSRSGAGSRRSDSRTRTRPHAQREYGSGLAQAYGLAHRFRRADDLWQHCKGSLVQTTWAHKLLWTHCVSNILSSLLWSAMILACAQASVYEHTDMPLFDGLLFSCMTLPCKIYVYEVRCTANIPPVLTEIIDPSTADSLHQFSSITTSATQSSQHRNAMQIKYIIIPSTYQGCHYSVTPESELHDVNHRAQENPTAWVVRKK